MSFRRYAVYFLPRGALGAVGAAWLGWDVVAGAAISAPGSAPEALVAGARRYGFHATLKPPFRLAKDATEAALTARVEALSAQQRPVTLDGLKLQRMGRFLALVPSGATGAIDALAASCVAGLEAFRAPLDPDEFARRATGLRPARRDLLKCWGHPFVMEAFRFHLTLTDRLGHEDLTAAEARLAAILPPLDRPLAIDGLAVVGEGADGWFRRVAEVRLGRK